MKKNTLLTAIFCTLAVIAWLVYQIGIDVRRVIVIEQGNETEVTGAHETGNHNAPATSKLHIEPKAV